MPNYDAGHYFLTALAPIRLDSVLIDGQSHSRRHLIREALANMPTGERTVASQGKGGDNPFARRTRTHFARVFVLDDVVSNGRVAGDSLLDRLQNIDPLTTQPVDRLSTPFLIFVADFDAQSGDESELDSYLAELWDSMGDELRFVCQHLVGFDGVATAQDFSRYIKKCQIETTMPFNDYWSAPPALADVGLVPYAIGGVIALLLAIFAPGWWRLIGLLALVLVVYLLYRKIVDTAQRPFPKSPPPALGSDLPTVLKALLVQRAFIEFAISAQGKSEAELHDSFGAFLTANKPNDIAEPTQRPGIIGV